MTIVVTGYSGFLGSFVCDALKEPYVLLGRKAVANKPHFSASFVQGEDYSEALNGAECVIHCAARVHMMNDNAADPLAEFRAVNTEGTLNLARQAAAAGVKRFIYISSIKVNGEHTAQGNPFTEVDDRLPSDPYGQSKSEAELALLELASNSGIEVVIIRPPLVYGPGVKANFSKLMGLVAKGVWLPFGSITENRRSVVSVRNLVDLILTCVEHPNAANQVFLVSDDNDISTATMIKMMANGLGVSGKMLPVPVFFYQLVGKILGKTDVVNRLTGSLQVDITHTKNTLSWSPPYSIESAFNETCADFLAHKE